MAETMTAVVTVGNGGFEMLEIREVPVPSVGPGQVRVKVLAAGVNNTEINTRLGWYSAEVTGSTDAAAGDAAEADEAVQRADGGWNAATPWPLIQGTDCCGIVDAIGDGVDPALLGRRVIIRACMRGPEGFASMDNVWMASDFDGAFAEFVTVPASEVFAVDCDWTHAELGAIPCAYGTAENMIHRAEVGSGERVLVTGASGGTGSASVQLARRRGAHVVAMASTAKVDAVLGLGAHEVIERGDTPEPQSFDVVVDNVAGPGFPAALDAIRRGGRYVSSGAIGGPIVDLDMRTFYLRDIRMIGCTAWDEPVFPNLVGYIERDEIRPLVAKTFPLTEIVAAQREFLTKTHVGKFVLIP
ncbi:MAG: alcohol dehydrogenase family protein [Actinomycetota bacterium]